MLDTFSIETFQPHVGEPFRVVVDEKWQMITILSSVSPWTEHQPAPDSRVPFSLVFHAKPDAQIPQRIYRIHSVDGTLEPFDCFLVPIGPDAGGMRYEAIFT
jgi:hypothetical protein